MGAPTAFGLCGCAEQCSSCKSGWGAAGIKHTTHSPRAEGSADLVDRRAHYFSYAVEDKHKLSASSLPVGCSTGGYAIVRCGQPRGQCCVVNVTIQHFDSQGAVFVCIFLLHSLQDLAAAVFAV